MLCMYGPESRPLQASRSKTFPPQLKNNWFRTLSIDRLLFVRIFVFMSKEGVKWVNPVCIKNIKKYYFEDSTKILNGTTPQFF